MHSQVVVLRLEGSLVLNVLHAFVSFCKCGCHVTVYDDQLPTYG